MPTKRTRKTRDQRARITDEAVRAFKTAQALHERYVECIASDDERPCAIGGGHCAECRTYLSAAMDLRAALRLKPWEVDPLTAGDVDELRLELCRRSEL
jgi:hypothetical protein